MTIHLTLSSQYIETARFTLRVSKDLNAASRCLDGVRIPLSSNVGQAFMN